MRKQLLIWVSVVGILSGLWVTAVQTQVVQCQGSFVPSLNCTIAGRWNYTNVTTSVNTITQGPIPFQAGGTDVTGIVSRVTDLTNAQVIALTTAPITVVPAPGTGYYVDVIGVSLIFNYTAAYATMTSDLKLYYTSRGGGNAASALIETTGFLDATADTIIRVSGTPDSTLPPITNQPVVIQATLLTAFTSGNAANTVRVVVNYRIVRTGL